MHGWFDLSLVPLIYPFFIMKKCTFTEKDIFCCHVIKVTVGGCIAGCWKDIKDTLSGITSAKKLMLLFLFVNMGVRWLCWDKEDKIDGLASLL